MDLVSALCKLENIGSQFSHRKLRISPLSLIRERFLESNSTCYNSINGGSRI